MGRRRRQYRAHSSRAFSLRLVFSAVGFASNADRLLHQQLFHISLSQPSAG